MSLLTGLCFLIGACLCCIAYLTYKYLVAMAALRMAISSELNMKKLLAEQIKVSSINLKAYFDERVKRIEYMRNI